MASAVLASRNEPHWGDPKVYMRRYTNNPNNNPHLNNFNPNPNPKSNPPNSNPNPNRHIHEFSRKIYHRQNDDPTPPKNLPSPPPPSDFLGGRETSHGNYVTFNLAEYSRPELKELKERLISELKQVQNLRARIEAQEIEPIYDYPVNPQFPGSYGVGTELAVVTRPSQLNHAMGSPRFAANEIGVTGKKKGPGLKRAQNFPSGRGPKRLAVSDSQVKKIVTSMMRRCKQILTKLMKHKHGWVFNTPVDTVGLGLHDYHRIIKQPMDLGTVQSRLNKNEYGSPLNFASDVRLTFNNAMMYNHKGQDVHTMAETLLALFETMFNDAYNKFESNHRRAVEQMNQRSWVPPPLPPPPPPPPQVAENAKRFLPDTMQVVERRDPMYGQQRNPVPVQLQEVQTSMVPVPGFTPLPPPGANDVGYSRLATKLPKPKARDPNKREMSLEEKEELGMRLQDLPDERMQQLLQIIEQRTTNLVPEGGELVLDIELLDNETLWELDRFVSKKPTVANVRQGSSNLTAPMNESPSISEAAMQKNKKGEAGDEDVDIGEEIPVSNFPPVEIEKDSSSGSGSDSSSSSGSDSDTGTSSDSGSDEKSVQSPFVEI